MLFVSSTQKQNTFGLLSDLVFLQKRTSCEVGSMGTYTDLRMLHFRLNWTDPLLIVSLVFRMTSVVYVVACPCRYLRSVGAPPASS